MFDIVTTATDMLNADSAFDVYYSASVYVNFMPIDIVEINSEDVAMFALIFSYSLKRVGFFVDKPFSNFYATTDYDLDTNEFGTSIIFVDSDENKVDEFFDSDPLSAAHKLVDFVANRVH